MRLPAVALVIVLVHVFVLRGDRPGTASHVRAGHDPDSRPSRIRSCPRRQADPLRDRRAGLEGEPPRRTHLSHQRRRHGPGAAHLRRARRIEPALVAGRQAHRVSRTRRDPDTNNQIYLLSAEGGEARRLTSAPDRSRPISPGRPTASRSTSSPPTRRRRTRRRRIACTTMCMRSRRPTSSSGTCGRRTWRARRRSMTEGDWSVSGYELSRRRHAHRHARARQSRCSSSCDRTEVWVMDANGANARQLTNNKVPEGERVAVARRMRRCSSPPARTSSSRSTTTTSCSWCRPPAARRACCCPTCRMAIEDAPWSEDGKTHRLHREHGRAQRSSCSVDVATQEVTQLTTGDHSAGRWRFTDDSGLHVFTLNTRSAPGRDLHVWPPARAAAARDRGVRRRSGEVQAWRARRRSRGRARTA